MRWPVGLECFRGDESFANAQKRVPVGNSQRQVCVFRGALDVDPVYVNEDEITGGGAHEHKGRAAGGLANRREEASKGLKEGAVR